MPKYLFIARFTTEGAKGLAREGGSARRETIAKLAESQGGKLESYYFAFGEDDAYITMDYPDNVTAAALALAVNQSGAVTVKTVVLMTPEEADAVSRKTVGYRAPGR